VKRRPDKRLATVVVTAGIVALLMLVLNNLPLGGTPTQPKPEIANNESAAEAHSDGVERHFQRGTALLQAGHFRQAAGEFHAVLRLAPALPEAHVNLGFALLSLGRVAAARDAFLAALNFRSTQVNAYWGLAVSLEQSCDVAGAVGAMRTYVHLADPDNPYLRRARSALWEWEHSEPCTPTHPGSRE